MCRDRLAPTPFSIFVCHKFVMTAEISLSSIRIDWNAYAFTPIIWNAKLSQCFVVYPSGLHHFARVGVKRNELLVKQCIPIGRKEKNILRV